MVHTADLHGDAAPCQALLQHAHVAAVAVQVQQVGEQVRDDHGVLAVRRILAGRRTAALDSKIARRGRLSRGRLDFAACGHGCVQRGLAPRQRRVVRDDVRAHLLRLLRDAMQQVVGVVNGLGVYAGILQAHGHVAPADAAGVCRQRARLRQLLEVDVPQPRHVAPVGLLVVDEEGHHLRRLVLRHDLEVLVEAGGVLSQVQQDAAAGKVVGLQAPVLRVERVDGLLQRLVRASQQACGNAHGGKVVHHIGAAEACRHRERPFAPGIAGAGLGKRERQPVGSQLHVFGGEIQRGAREAAVRAMPFAQLPVLAPVVFEHGGAALAHGGVGDGVLRQAHALGHAEGDRPRALAARQLPGAVGDGRAQRIVGVVYQHGFRRAAQRLDDAVLDAVDLAAAIKLVAEQVEQHHVVRAQLRQDLRQPQLVALEHAPVGLAGMQQRRGHARIQVRARAVADDPLARRFKHVGKQVGNGGLAVGPHHAHAAAIELAAQMRDKLRVHVQGHFAREVCGGAVEHVFQAPSGDAADGAGGGESQSHGFLAYLRKCMRPVYPALGRPPRIAAFQR